MVLLPNQLELMQPFVFRFQHQMSFQLVSSVQNCIFVMDLPEPHRGRKTRATGPIRRGVDGGRAAGGAGGGAVAGGEDGGVRP